MWQEFQEQFLAQSLPPEVSARVDEAVQNVNSAGFDRWGVDPKTLKSALVMARWLYLHYFRVETHGLQNLPSKGRALLVGNHGGQVPVDGFLLFLSILLEATPPRIARGMLERWVPSLPFISTLFNRCGQVVGDQKNCKEFLEHDQCVMVFPEGVRGSGKTIDHRYQLQEFGTGFLRLALETQSPIVPVGIIGTEEIYPGLYNLKPVAKAIKAPYFPITPFFPLLGPLGLIPLPCKVTIRFGKPLRFDLDPDAPDSEVQKLVDQVKSSLQSELSEGLKIRDERIFTGSAK